jgi:outer membrane protein assembly complex protein YaeT
MRAAALWLTGAIVLIASAASADVADFLGKPVASLQVEIEGRVLGDPRVLALIETQPGRPLSMVAVRESVTHLFALGRFEDVRVAAEAAPTGVRLIYDLVPIHPIRRMVFVGPMTLPGIDEGRLRGEVVERYGVSPPPGRRFDLSRVIEDDLKAHGYLHAAVEADIEIAHDPDRSTLLFKITPGIRTHIGSIEVTGSPGSSTAQLLSRLGLKTGMPYQRETINTSIQQYQQSRWADGFVEATLVLSTRFEDGDRLVHLSLNAVQGPRVRVIFKGDSIPQDRQTELVPVAEEASADEDLLEDSSNRIVEYLNDLGYRDATASHVRQQSEEELLITFTVTRGPLYRVSDVTISGVTDESLAALQPTLRLRKELAYSDEALDADLSIIEDYYRRRGFASVRLEPLVDPGPGASATEVPLSVRIVVTEGVRTLVRSVQVQGNLAVSDTDLRQGLGLTPGSPFFPTQLAIDRDTMQLHYADRGYRSALITGSPKLSSDGSAVDIVFDVNEGPQLIVDHLIIVGNVRTSSEIIERELQIKTGDPLGLAALSESQRRLAELGLFRRVRIEQVPHGAEDSRDLVVTVEEAPVTTIGYGGGLEALQRSRTEAATGVAVEQLEFAPRAFFEIGRRNLFGKNRSINLFTRISLRPDPAQSSDDNELGFSEYRVFGAFREPRLFGTAAEAFLTSTFEQQGRSSFNFSRRVFSAEVARRLTGESSISGNYQIQRTDLFDENIAEEDKLLIDRLFPQLLLSSFSVSGAQSTRDDAVNPTSGYYLSASGQLAARQIGSEVGLFKSYVTAQNFRTLPRSRAVLATSVRLGMAYGFPRTIVRTNDAGEPILQGTGEPLTDVARDLPASERFFAGGDTTVRGFALDQLGTASTLDRNGFAIGGNAVLVLNAELRVPVFRALDVVGFLDGGNVFARTSEIDFGELRSAVGLGIRYRSPVGPLRVDVGFKTRRREIVPGSREEPLALHISLGQAF